MLSKITDTFWMDLADIFYFNFDKEECCYEMRLRSVPDESIIINDEEIAHIILKALDKCKDVESAPELHRRDLFCPVSSPNFRTIPG